MLRREKGRGRNKSGALPLYSGIVVQCTHADPITDSFFFLFGISLLRCGWWVGRIGDFSGPWSFLCVVVWVGVLQGVHHTRVKGVDGYPFPAAHVVLSKMHRLRMYADNEYVNS